MSGDPDTHPLNFENLSFNVISHYLTDNEEVPEKGKTLFR